VTGPGRTVRSAQDLVQECRLLKLHADPAEAAEFADRLDEFSREFATAGDLYRESATWCRLAAGLLRGEDIPESIHKPAGEDPADTARWQKWRVS
jgi:hypothetical protein